MRKFLRISAAFIVLSIILGAGMASADLYYTASTEIGRVEGDNTATTRLIENLGRGDSAYGADGWTRLITIPATSSASSCGVKIYAPCSGDGWEAAPEAEANVGSAEVTAGWDDNREYNARGMEVLGNSLYIAYFAQDIGFNGAIDGSTRIVQYDISNGFKKKNQFIFKPEEKDPDAAANAMDVLAYNGKIYGIYTGYSKKNASNNYFGYYTIYGPYDSYVVELDENLTPTGRELIVPSRSLYLGMNSGPSCYTRDGNILCLAAAGVPESLTMYDTEMERQNVAESAISIVNLDTMELEAAISGENFDSSWKTPFKRAVTTGDGVIYFYAYDNPVWTWVYEQYVYRTTVENMKKISDMTDANIDDLEKEGLVEKIWEGSWEGNGYADTADLDIVYDKLTGYVWWNAGSTGICRYKADGSGGAPELLKDSKLQAATSLFVAYDAQIPSITAVQPGGAVFGKEYRFQLLAEGSPAPEWSIVSGELPSGLSLDASSGVISGTPESSGDYTFTVKAENIADSVSREITLTVTDERVAPVITLAALPDGTAGSKYSAALTASGTAPIAWSVAEGELPEGLLLNAETGEISGTPVTAGDYNFTVKASNAVGEYSMEYTLTIAAEPSQPSTGGGSGGGCNAGMGALALLAFLPLAALGRKK